MLIVCIYEFIHLLGQPTVLFVLTRSSSIFHVSSPLKNSNELGQNSSRSEIHDIIYYHKVTTRRLRKVQAGGSHVESHKRKVGLSPHSST